MALRAIDAETKGGVMTRSLAFSALGASFAVSLLASSAEATPAIFSDGHEAAWMQLAQADSPDVDISAFLPAGVSMDSATDEEIDTAVAAALETLDDDAAEALIQSLASMTPDRAARFAAAAARVRPQLAARFAAAAARGAPDQAVNIVRAVAAAAPGAVADIVAAVLAAVPDADPAALQQAAEEGAAEADQGDGENDDAPGEDDDDDDDDLEPPPEQQPTPVSPTQL